MHTHSHTSPDVDKLIADCEDSSRQLGALIDDLAPHADIVATGDGVMRSPADDDRLAGLPRLLSVGDVCRVFDVHPRTISRWIDRGDFIPPVRLPGGHLRFPAADIADFITDSQG